MTEYTLQTASAELRKYPGTDSTISFPLSAGLLNRGQLRGALDSCKVYYRNLVIEWAEIKGWFESGFQVRAEGPSEDLAHFCDYVNSILD